MNDQMPPPSATLQGNSERLLQSSVEWGQSPRNGHRIDQSDRTRYSTQDTDIMHSTLNGSHGMKLPDTAPMKFARTDLSRTCVCRPFQMRETLNQSTLISDQENEYRMRKSPESVRTKSILQLQK